MNRLPAYRTLLTVAAAATLLLAACATGADEPGSAGGGPAARLRAKPLAFGDVNRVVVVADDELLAGPVGDSLRYYYEQAYPLMPQPEPLYDLRFMTPEQLMSRAPQRELRAYVVLADLTAEDSPTTQLVAADVGEERLLAARENPNKGSRIVGDRWARDQTVIYLFAEGHDELADLVARSFPAASRRLAEGDRPKLEANVYQAGRSRFVADSVRALTGLALDLPSDYRLARADEDLVWLRRDLGEVIQNLIVSSVPYTGTEQVSADSAVAYRNRLGRAAVRSNTVGSYMTTNDRDLPLVTEATEIGGRYALEVRGVWEMTDDFMGGPFFTYLLPDPEAGRLYVLDAFAYAPGKGKRNYMQQLELIARSATVPDGARRAG